MSSGVAATGQSLLGSFSNRQTSNTNFDGTTVSVSTNGDAPAGDLGVSIWVRAGYFWTKADSKLNGAAGRGSYDQDAGIAQAGISSLFLNNANGQAIASLYGHVGTSSTDAARNGVATGTSDTNSLGAGFALTWVDAAGWYADLNNQITAHNIDTTSFAPSTTGETDGTTLAVSIEAGWKIKAASGLTVIPQAQLAYQRIGIASFTDTGGDVHSFADNDSFEGRIGVKLETDDLGNGFRADVQADIIHEFLDGGTASTFATPVGLDMQGTAAKIGGGISFQPVGSDLKLWSEASYRMPFGDGRETLGLTAGIRLNF